jgi:uncharacterized protein DUF5753
VAGADLSPQQPISKEPPVARDGQVSALALFSGELRQARTRAGLTQDQLAEKLQTEDYAGAVLVAAHPAAPDGEVDRLVSARMDRQAILGREPPPLLWVIVDEGVLTRPVGGAGVMREQIGRLIMAACQPKIVLQVLPAVAGAHPGLAGQFVIAGFDGAADVAYLDNALAGQVVERADDVARVTLLYDILKAEALPRQASIDLARKAIERWT